MLVSSIEDIVRKFIVSCYVFLLLLYWVRRRGWGVKRVRIRDLYMLSLVRFRLI